MNRFFISDLKKFEQEIIETDIVLGEGSYSTVILGKSIDEKKEFAIKKINREWLNNSDIECIKKEVFILSKLKHNNIIKFYGHYYDENFIYLIMERGKSLEMLTYRGSLEEKKVKKITRDIFNGLHYLKKNNIIHYDIKIPNIIIVDDVAKICDFGLSDIIINVKKEGESKDNINNKLPYKYSEDDAIISNNGKVGIKGSTNYIAPEIMSNGDISFQIDIWSCGILILKLITNYFLRNYNTSELYLYFRHTNVSEDLVKLIKSMLVLNSYNRITIEDLVNHKWFDN